MHRENEPDRVEAETDRAEAEKVKRQTPTDTTDDGKPDEGLRPDQLTSENDGGAEG